MTVGELPADAVAEPDEELLDRDDLPLEERRRALDDLARVNLLLFGRRALRREMLPRILALGEDRQMMLDVAAGAGDATAALRRAARTRGVELVVVSADRKLSHLLHGRRRGFVKLAVVAEAELSPFRQPAVDWVVSSLFFHHLEPAERVATLADQRRTAKRAAVAVDLRRSLWALWAFRALGRLIGLGSVALGDGVVSLRRTWTVAEWRRFARAAEGRLRLRFPARVTVVAEAEEAPSDTPRDGV